MTLSKLLPLYVVIFFGFMGYSMMLTLFTPLFMYAQHGLIPPGSSLNDRIIVLGVVLSLFPLAQFFSAPVLGTLSDRYGRKPILILSLGIAPICYALMAISLTIESLALLMLSSFIAGISQGNIAIAQSAIADIAPRSDRSRYFGYVYLSASTSYVAGPLLGGKLSDPALVSAFSYATPFWIVFALLVLTFFWTLRSFKETKLVLEKHIGHGEAFASLLTIFTSRKLRFYYAINFLIYFAIFGFFRCYPMYIVSAFQVNTSKLSEYIAWVSVPIILVNLGLTGKLARHFSPKTVTIWSCLFTGLFMLLIVLPSSQDALWITLFLTAAALALSLPACAAMLSLEAEHSEQGRILGNNQSLQVAAEALSAFAGGLLASIAIPLSLVLLGLLACGTAILLFFFARFRIRSG